MLKCDMASYGIPGDFFLFVCVCLEGLWPLWEGSHMELGSIRPVFFPFFSLSHNGFQRASTIC